MGVVVLPSDAKLPDGAKVEVIPLQEQADDPPFLRAILTWPSHGTGQKTSLSTMLITGGIPFVVMQDNGLSEAFTADHHFEQAGFKALLA